MKTDRLPTQKLHNEEWFELQSECKEGIELFDPEEIGIKYLYDGYAPLTVKADKALKVLQKSSYTHEMEETDKKRGEVCVGFFGTVRSAAKQLDPNKQKAALHLYNLVEGYRNSIVNGTYTEETAAIYNMLQDLRGPYAADITLLGFANWVDDIAASWSIRRRAMQVFPAPFSPMIMIRASFRCLEPSLSIRSTSLATARAPCSRIAFATFMRRESSSGSGTNPLANKRSYISPQ